MDLFQPRLLEPHLGGHHEVSDPESPKCGDCLGHIAFLKLFANRKLVPRLVSDEVVRIGYCVSRPKTHRSTA